MASRRCGVHQDTGEPQDIAEPGAKHPTRMSRVLARVLRTNSAPIPL
jgi:hypothetical protein